MLGALCWATFVGESKAGQCWTPDHVVEIGSHQEPLLRIWSWSARNRAVAWERIAESLQLYDGVLLDMEAEVAVYAQMVIVPLIFDEVVPLVMYKNCNETFSAAARRMGAAYSGGGTVGGGGGGGGGGFYRPVVVNWTGWTFSCTIGGVPVSCDGY